MNDGKPSWTFLSNYSHVLICLSRDPHLTMREVAMDVGITERAVQRIVRELIEAGVITAEKQGRRNVYHVNLNIPLRHPLESHRTVGDLLKAVKK
jgi:predicted transcriptional regulator